jgi:hypothetical protein
MAAMSDEDLATLTPVEFVRGLKVTVLYEEAEYRLTACEYQTIDSPDLFLEFRHEHEDEGGWNDQVPLPLTAEKARAIAAGLIAWADSQVEAIAVKYGEDAVDEAETFAHYADDAPSPNRFDSVEVSGLVEPVGVDS